jgi:GNAT superfamily N-acetyltransferase
VSDTDVIADFNSRMALETEQRRLNAERLRKGVAALLIDSAKGVYFLAEVKSENETGARTIAGQLMLTYEWSDWRNGNFWWIQSVYVVEEFRGQGVFKILFQHVFNLAKARNDVCGLRLYMDGHNHGARQAYDRIGFHRTNYEMFEIEFG